MKKSYRQGRLAEEIKKIISTLLYRGLKDPRFSGLVSITEVKVDREGSFATVYVSVVGDGSTEESTDKEKQDVLDAFQSAKGLIRKEIGTQLQLRHTPDLRFKVDTSEEYGRHIEKLINELGLDE